MDHQPVRRPHNLPVTATTPPVQDRKPYPGWGAKKHSCLLRSVAEVLQDGPGDGCR
jgi:hypothetical protein